MIRYSSDLLAARAQLGDDDFDALLVDGAQTVARNLELDPAILAGHPEAALVKVRQPAAARLVVGVGNTVAGLETLSGDLAYLGHANLVVVGYRPWPGRKRPSGDIAPHDAGGASAMRQTGRVPGSCPSGKNRQNEPKRAALYSGFRPAWQSALAL